MPADADFDLYLYQDAYVTTTIVSNDSSGEPIIAAKSTNAGAGVAETINYTAPATGRYYVVVKWVSGVGDFTLSSTGPAIFSTVGQFVKPGWNLVSLPGQPTNPDPLAVFTGIDVANSSFLYWKNNATPGAFQLYGSAFGWTGPVVMGTPYWFLHSGNPTDLSFAGTPHASPWTLTFPASTMAPRWVMFGHMKNQPSPCTGITFSSTSQPTPVSWDIAYANGLVDSVALGFSSASMGFFRTGPPASLPDQPNVEPWYGYWLLVRTGDAVTVTFP